MNTYYIRTDSEGTVLAVFAQPVHSDLIEVHTSVTINEGDDLSEYAVVGGELVRKEVVC